MNESFKSIEADINQAQTTVWSGVADGKGSSGDAEGDSLFNIEGIIGSAYKDTVIFDGLKSSYIITQSGADILVSGGFSKAANDNSNIHQLWTIGVMCDDSKRREIKWAA